MNTGVHDLSDITESLSVFVHSEKRRITFKGFEYQKLFIDKLSWVNVRYRIQCTSYQYLILYKIIRYNY